MADQEKDRQMNQMLDSLLANYSSAEPRPGLETRILANLREAESREASRGWWGFKWLWAGAVLAALIVAGMLVRGKRHVAPPAHTVVQTTQPDVQQPIIQQPSVQRPSFQSREPVVAGAERVIHRHKTLVPEARQSTTLALNQRPAVFPTPTPLSEQERMLLQYYSSTPREEVITQSHPDEPPVVGNQEGSEAIPDLTYIPQKLSNTQ